MTENNRQVINNNRLQIDVKVLPAGIYILMIQGDKEMVNYKLKKL